MNVHDELREKELSLREDLANVQDTVLGLNEQEAAFRTQRIEVKALQKQTAIERHQVVVALRERQQRLAKSFPVKPNEPGAKALYSQLEALDHTRASLKATERQIDLRIDELDASRRPYIESQQRLFGQIERTIDAQHNAYLNPNPETMEDLSMNGPDDFRRASSQQNPLSKNNKPPASVQRLNELRKRLEKPKPSPELTPPGMAPNLAKRVKNNKAIGEEIVRIQKALNARRGKARDAFKRSSGG